MGGHSYIQASAGATHTLLLRSDGKVVACGFPGQCRIPALDDGLSYVEVSAGSRHSVLLRSDGCAIGCGNNDIGQCEFPATGPGILYGGPRSGDRVVQLEICEETAANGVILACSGLAGQEVLRLEALESESALEMYRRMARELKVYLPNLRVVLPQGELLADFCRDNPAATVADVILALASDRVATKRSEAPDC